MDFCFDGLSASAFDSQREILVIVVLNKEKTTAE